MPKRQTIQNQLVLTAFLSMETHATAEQVYQQLHESYPNISRATVYRNLNSLADDGVIQKIATCTAERFDFSLHEHFHLHCRACGRFEDAPMDWDGTLLESAAQNSGYLIEQKSIVFTGLCPTCREEKAETNNNYNKRSKEYAIKRI